VTIFNLISYISCQYIPYRRSILAFAPYMYSGCTSRNTNPIWIVSRQNGTLPSRNNVPAVLCSFTCLFNLVKISLFRCITYSTSHVHRSLNCAHNTSILVRSNYASGLVSNCPFRQKLVINCSDVPTLTTTIQLSSHSIRSVCLSCV
jgi:hypothetical protein